MSRFSWESSTLQSPNRRLRDKFTVISLHPVGISGALIWFLKCNVGGRVEYHILKGNSAMRIEATKKLFTVDEYYRMVEVGILGAKDRVELIDGEIIEMSPIGVRHIACVHRATEAFIVAFKGRAVVSVQSPLRLNDYTEPQPDLILLKHRPDYYSAKRVMADDAILALEVADTSLHFDRTVKLPRYAAAGVPEVWIENLKDNLLLVYRDLSNDAYATSLTFRHGDSVSVLAFPDVIFKVDDLLG